jgi:alpha-N-arabinofuranosidase
LFAAEGLHEIFRHSDIITMGGYTAVTSCINFNATDACYSSIGLLFKLYRQHFGTIPLEISGNSPQHPVKGTVGVDKPAKSSGSDTWPLDVMAAMTEDRKKVTVAVVNPTETEQEMVLNFTGAAFQKGAKEYRIAFPDRMARNIPGKDPEVTVQESVLKKIQEKIQAVPLSISLYEFVIK